MDIKSPQLWTREELEGLIREVIAHDQVERGEQLITRLRELSQLGIKPGCTV